MGPNGLCKSHCGIAAHSRKLDGASKFSPIANTFYINGGCNRERPTAKKDPSIHWSEVPQDVHYNFVHKLKTSKQWTSLFIEISEDAYAQEASVGKSAGGSDEDSPKGDPMKDNLDKIEKLAQVEKLVKPLRDEIKVQIKMLGTRKASDRGQQPKAEEKKG